jgi:aminoglycoside phosphotransferase family enzyme
MEEGSGRRVQHVSDLQQDVRYRGAQPKRWSLRSAMLREEGVWQEVLLQLRQSDLSNLLAVWGSDGLTYTPAKEQLLQYVVQFHSNGTYHAIPVHLSLTGTVSGLAEHTCTRSSEICKHTCL